MELYHHGIEGQKWGVRRFQNPDGSLTEEGRRRYLKPGSRYGFTIEQEQTFANKFLTKKEKEDIRQARKNYERSKLAAKKAFEKKLYDAGFWDSPEAAEWELHLLELLELEKVDNAGEAEYLDVDGKYKEAEEKFMKRIGLTRDSADPETVKIYKETGQNIVNRLMGDGPNSIRDYTIEDLNNSVKLTYTDREAISKLIAGWSWREVKDIL